MRSKEQTTKHLLKVYKHASTVGSQTQAKRYKTAKGVKCTFQEHFIQKINDFTKDLRCNQSEKQLKLNRYLMSFLENKINPLRQLKGEKVVINMVCTYALLL